MKRRLLPASFGKAPLVAFLTLTTVLTSQAQAEFLYGDFHGDCVDFLMVTESNAREPQLFWGDIEASANTLIVDPTDFRVEASPGPNTDFLDSQLEMMIEAHPGNFIDGILYTEFGDYFLGGDATVTASLNWFMSIPGAGTVGGTETFVATQSSGLTTDTWSLGLDIDLVNGTVNGEPLVDLTTGQPITVPAEIDKVTFEFDNTLLASAVGPVDTAFIAKKSSNGIQVHTECVPEPSTVGLALTAILMAFVRLRRS